MWKAKMEKILQNAQILRAENPFYNREIVSTFFILYYAYLHSSFSCRYR